MTQPKILVIEDQKAMADLLQEQIREQSGMPVEVAYDFSQAKALLESGTDFVACITDLNLPDAEEAATVPLLHSHHVSTVVLTANYTEETRQKMFDLRVADYVIKDGLSAINYAVKTVVNLVENAERTIWVLSNQSKSSKRLLGLLNIQRYRVAMFDDEQQLLATLKSKTPDLLIVNEAKTIESLDAVKFVQKVRDRFSQNKLPILLTEEQPDMAEIIKLMKYGVNDFYNHKFTVEELYVRVYTNLSLALSFKEIEKISQTDPLTGLYNRRYLFAQAEQMKKQAKDAFAVMFDIDHFKQVNDQYGHEKGDEAIIFVAQLIQQVFAEQVVARFGGEEFCAIGYGLEVSEIMALAEEARAKVESLSVKKIDLPLTISIGLCCHEEKIDKLIGKADKALYRSKQAGRNQVSCFSQI